MAPVTVHGPATCRRGWTRVELDPQRIDEHAQELFGHLDCVPLAVELHRRTGWPLAMTERRKRPLGGGECEWGWDHVVVRHPDGGLVDIDGHRPEGQLMADRAADGYPGQQQVRDLHDEDALRRVLNLHPAQRPDLTSWAWHAETTSGHDTAQTYLELVVTPLAATLLRETGLLPPPATTATPATAPTTKTTTKGHTAMSTCPTAPARR